MKFKASIFVLLSFVCYICGILNINITNKGKINVSYIVDRSLSSLFIPDNVIQNWIKEDIKQRKVDNFNIISFGCDFNQSQTFTFNSNYFLIPKINSAFCSNINNVFNSAYIFDNAVVISDLKFSTDYNSNISKTYNIEFVRLDDFNIDTLKIVSWQIPRVVFNRTNIKGVIQIISKVNDIIEITVHYANKVKRFYRKVRENKYEYIPFNVKTKLPFKLIKIKIRDISNNDKYILNNTFVSKLTFINKIPAYIESKHTNVIFAQNKNYIEKSPLEKSEILIIDTQNLKKVFNLIRQHNNTKHIITFLDTFILDNIATYKNIEKFLPIKLESNKQRQIFFLIDVSGSMNIVEESETFNISGITILNGIIELLKQLSESQNTHIYLFNNRYKEIPFSNIEELKTKLLNIQFFGNTFIVPVLEEIYKQVKGDAYIYIFSDTVVKDKVNKLEQVINNISKKNGKLFLFSLGNKKSKLYKVFRKLRQKVLNFSSINKTPIYENMLRTDKTTYVVDYAKIYTNDSERYLFSTNDLLNTKLKSTGINILHSNLKPFATYLFKNNYMNAVILKNVDYLLKNNISIKEILSPILGIIAQKDNPSVHPYYFNGRFRIHINKFNTTDSCPITKLKTRGGVIYLFKKSTNIYESDSVIGMDMGNKDMELDICSEKKKISLDNNLWYHYEIFYTTTSLAEQSYYNANIVQFPQHTQSKLKINNDNKSIIWFVMSFILLIIESIRKII